MEINSNTHINKSILHTNENRKSIVNTDTSDCAINSYNNTNANETLSNIGKSLVFKGTKENKNSVDLKKELETKTIINSNGEEEKRFNKEEIESLLALGEDNKDLILKLADEQVVERNGDTEPRFATKTIIHLVKLSETSPTIVEKILNAHEPYGTKVEDYGTEKIIDACQKDPAFTEQLLDIKTKNYSDEEVLQYSSLDILKLVDAKKKNEELFNKLFTAKEKNYKGEEQPQYTATEITSIMSNYDSNPELVTMLFNEKITDKNGNESPRFSTAEIDKITDLSSENPELVLDLLKEKYVDYQGLIKPRFKARDIETYIETFKQNPQFTDYLRKQKDIETDDSPRFEADDIKRIVNLRNDENESFIKYLISSTEKNPLGEPKARFHTYSIEPLLEAYKKSPESVMILLNEKSTDRYGNTNPTYDYSEITRLINADAINSELTMSLVKHKLKIEDNHDFHVFSDFDISRITKNAGNHTKELSKICTETINQNGNNIPRFNMVEIDKLENMLNINSELVINLIKEKINDKDGISKPKYSAKDIQEIVEADLKRQIGTRFSEYEEKEFFTALRLNPKLALELLNDPANKSGFSIANDVLDNFKQDLKSKKTDNKIYSKSVYNEKEISKLADCAKKNPELTKFLIEEKLNTVTGEKQHYSVNEIEKLINIANNKPELVERLVSLRTPHNNNFPIKYTNIENICSLTKYNDNSILNIINALVNNRELFLDSLEDLDKCVEEIAPFYKGNEKEVEQLLRAKSYSKINNETTFAYIVSDIPVICKLIKDYPKETKYLINQTYIAPNGDKVSRFNRYDLGIMQYNMIETPKITKSLIDEKIKNKDSIEQPKYTVSEIDILSRTGEIWGKNSVAEMTKQEKRKFSQTIMLNKNVITNNVISDNIKEKVPFFPKNEKEYAVMMTQLANGLNIPLKTVSPEITDEFNKSIFNLANTVKETDLSKSNNINLKISHTNFINNIQTVIKNLPKTEQAKICDLYGFNIIDGKLSGYPHTENNNIDLSDITDTKSIQAAKKVENIVQEYSNKNCILINNPELKQELNNLAAVMPEIYNQLDSNNDFIKTLKSLKEIVSSEEYNNLSINDKKIIILSTLLQKTDKFSNNVVESGFDAYFIAKKFNLPEKDAQKIYTIIETNNVIDKFMETTKHKKRINNIGSLLNSSEREIVFDMIAHKLKNENLHELSGMLYKTNYPNGFTRRFDDLLDKRILEIKSTDFMLPQTSQDEMIKYASEQTIEKDGQTYKINIVNASDIPDFYAFAHTTEAGYSTGGTRSANFANFDIFNTLNDDKVICTAYISADRAGLINQFHHAFIFDVKNSNQYVASNHDIASYARDIEQMISEYYRNKNIQDVHGDNQYNHRIKISKTIKNILYGNTQDKNTDIDYIKRLEHIKQELGDKNLSVALLKEIDPEFAKAYETILTDGYDGILASKPIGGIHHNEVLISNPSISAIATDDINKLPIEYLQKAQEENLPVVVFKTK